MNIYVLLNFNKLFQMFKLYRKFMFYTSCFECEITRNVCLNLVFHKSTLCAQDKKHKLDNNICNFHHDTLDIFTNTLILQNINKWNTHRFSNTNELSKVKSNSIFKLCDDTDLLIKYLQQCIDGNSKVTESTLKHFMLTMAKHGQIDGLILIEKLNEKYNYSIKKTELQMNFAEAYWTNGNLDSMFNIFEALYLTEPSKINYVLEPIINTIVKSRGIASVVMVSTFVNSIAIKYDNYYPMCTLWKYFFLSDLYNNNLEAEKLLQQNKDLIKYIHYLVPVITKCSLKKHNIDCVQRLMVILLKYNQTEIYQWVLRTLFEYYCKYIFE